MLCAVDQQTISRIRHTIDFVCYDIRIFFGAKFFFSLCCLSLGHIPVAAINTHTRGGYGTFSQKKNLQCSSFIRTKKENCKTEQSTPLMTVVLGLCSYFFPHLPDSIFLHFSRKKFRGHQQKSSETSALVVVSLYFDNFPLLFLLYKAQGETTTHTLYILEGKMQKK